ncbi:ABC transporter substrate-binding protein [Deinococcus misasensis]|uniref:ABC transporter substrate-binding protein n=1 Tax=Deinococcus misasensis TaxID=392413 RepID=UPI00054F6205|nr:extracellular solute-binding protein [Deinococcus misasensis]
MPQRTAIAISLILTSSLALAQQKTVTVFGNFTGQDQQSFQKVINAFEAKNPGIKVNYTGSADFVTLINVRVQAGNYPDIAAIPQPGVMYDLAQKGVLVPLWNSALTLVKRNYSPAWLDLGTAEDGKAYGIFHRVNVKGLVFYNKTAFKNAGYKVPKTWPELQALTKKMAATKTAPWCIGIESGGATGWAATDWLENILLRTAPASVYDKWITNKVKFDSPEVRKAWGVLDDIVTTPGYVYGGKTTVAVTNFRDASQGVYANPAKCWMNLQGSFATGFLQDDVQANLDKEVGVFMLPMIDEKLPTTLEVGGDQYVVFKGKDRPEVKKFMEFLATGASAAPWAADGGALFPHKDQNRKAYKTQLEQSFVRILLSAKAARFDASDAMPSAVNLAFWKGTTDYFTGKNLDQVLKDIDAAYGK